MKLKILLPFVILPAIFIAALGVQTNMQIVPQMILLVYTLGTIAASLLKQKKLNSALVGGLILFCGFFLWFLIANGIIYSIWPRVKSDLNVSDYKWIISLAVAVVLSVGTTFLYFRKIGRNKELENYNLVAYAVMTVALIFAIELR